MSFLNPANEPVMRFSSTDTDAPQINYAARTAGDVKTVLKACLVTGYGAKASAGWSIVNEVDHVAEFVSTSAAMSDYRLGIVDTSASSTTWYYQYQDARNNPAYNSITKGFSYADQSHPDNGWQLLVTPRGVLFIELIQHTEVNKLSARVTYLGQLKSGLIDQTGGNIIFFNFGHSNQYSAYFFSEPKYTTTNVSGHTGLKAYSANSAAFTDYQSTLDVAVLDLISPIYYGGSRGELLVAELPCMLSHIVNKSSDVYGIRELDIDGRPVLSVCIGSATPAQHAAKRSITMAVRLDYWGF